MHASLWRRQGSLVRDLRAVRAGLPAPWRQDVHELSLRTGWLAARHSAPLAVVDDDPTGTQTVHSVPVLADFTVDTFEAALRDALPCFYVLSNTRALGREAACDRARQIGASLREAAARAGCLDRLAVVSRGDSTLRGHYPYETDALCEGLGWAGGADLTVLAPFFFEGGRLTVDNMHFVADPATGLLTPVAETEFANDRAFGFASSDLTQWVEEKTDGRVQATDVVSLSLTLIREGGPDAVCAHLEAAPRGSVVVANALAPEDMAVVALGCLQAEAKGRQMMYRTAGAFVAARAAIPPRPLLSVDELHTAPAPSAATHASVREAWLQEAADPSSSSSSVAAQPSSDERVPAQRAGLVVVGSYVKKSSDQLSRLLHLCPWAQPIEIDVGELVQGGDKWAAEEARARTAVDGALRAGQSVVLHTSRKVLQDDGAGGLLIGQRVTDALCSIVRDLDTPPAWLVAKGGITSNDVAVEALGVRRAMVLGAIVPGVPVWGVGASKRPYVVFPGNVGQPDDLARAVVKLAGRGGDNGDGVGLGCGAAQQHGGTLGLLREALARGRAVGAFNVYNLEGVRAVLGAAERAGDVPVMLQVHPASLEFGGVPLLQLCHAAAAASTAPVAVQLDHTTQAHDVYRGLASRTLDSVMIDGSEHALDENIAWTAEMAALAHASGVSVEAELGRLAGEEDGLSVAEVEAKMTDPAVVPRFLHETGADALAVTIGNVHGKYARSPQLDFVRLDRIRAVAGDVPLVLHGASGLDAPIIEAAMARGVCKFNVNTALRAAARAANTQCARDGDDVLATMRATTAAMQAAVDDHLRLFGWLK